MRTESDIGRNRQIGNVIGAVVTGMILSFGAGPVRAVTITNTTAVGQGADTFIQSTLSGNDAANKNFGSNIAVGIKHDTGLPGHNRKGYFRFDLGAIPAPITDVHLELTYWGKNQDTPANPSTYNVYGLRDGHAGENWDELAITWNNAPGNNPASAGGVSSADTTLLGTFNLSFPGTPVGAQIPFSSPALLSFVQGDTNGLITLIVTRQQRNFSIEYFASKEEANLTAPALIIKTAPPEPPALRLHMTATNTVVVSWPATAPGYVLQCCTNLAAGNWCPVPEPVSDDGTNRRVVVPAAAECQIYRLRWQ